MKIILALLLLVLTLPTSAEPDLKPLAEKEDDEKIYFLPPLESSYELNQEQLARLTQMREEIAWFKVQTVPRPGTSREEIEKKFGIGRPVHARQDKSGPQGAIPENSPRRQYTFASTETLGVLYDEDWKVVGANYLNPFQTSGGPFTTNDFVYMGRLHGETPGRFKQMQRIVEEYKKLFKTTAMTEEEYIERLRQKTAWFEAYAIPSVGTARPQVESRFGAGVPVSAPGKTLSPGKFTENSLYRSYKVLIDSELFVSYDIQWKVARAFLVEPAPAKQRPADVPVPIEEQRQEAERKLKQMEWLFNIKPTSPIQ